MILTTEDTEDTEVQELDPPCPSVSSVVGKILLQLAALLLLVMGASAQTAPAGFVGHLRMDMMILPGTANYLKDGIDRAASDGASALVVELDTPGGVLATTQEMVQTIFDAPIPVIIYITPTGSTATSAGVFITLAGHIAAMAPGTTIGAAHPVSQEGKDIEGDMRKKVESATVAMVKTIAQQRGRNVAWAEKAVTESSSLTDTEALKQGVIDFVAPSVPQLMKQISGKSVTVQGKPFVLGDYSEWQVREYQMALRDTLINVFAHPNVLALLWLIATTAISIELYNPGAVIPGVVGVISLILALAMSQIIPMNEGALALLLVGALLIGADIFVGSIALGVGGVIGMVLGASYLIDTDQAPGLAVSFELIAPIAVMLGGILLFAATTVARAFRLPIHAGLSGLIGAKGRALEPISSTGTAMINGEEWKAESRSGIIQKGEAVIVKAVHDGLTVEVAREED